MTWEIVSAIGSLLAGVVLLVASIAAVLQLRHLRLSNQMTAYFHIMEGIYSPEFLEARQSLESLDPRNPATLDAMIAKDSAENQHVRIVGNFFQSTARLMNFGVLDEDLFNPIAALAASTWRLLRPFAYEYRKRHDMPLWADIEYLAFRYAVGRSKFTLQPYAADFCERVGIEGYPQTAAGLASAAFMAEPPKAVASRA